MADIVLKDRNGNDVTYEGIETVTFDTPTEGVQATYTEGVAVEEVPIVLDLAKGDQTVTAATGTLVRSAVIQKPETLIPENVRKDVTLAGVEGGFIGDTEEAEVALSMAAGDQVIEPSAEGKVLSRVVVKKPEGLAPENIAKDVDVGGVIGTFEGAREYEPGAPDWIEDICFWDYDGTLILQLAVSEAKNLSALPTPPTHEGLTFQEWNYTLEEVQATERPLDVGATYITADGNTHVTLEVTNSSYSAVPVHFQQDVENGVSIDWGDGSATETVAGTGVVTTTHTYSAIGTYEVVFTVQDGCTMTLGGGTSSTSFIGGGNTTYRRYATALHIGENVALGEYSLYWCGYIARLTIPRGYTEIPAYFIYYIYYAPVIVVPRGIETINAFGICYALAEKHHLSLRVLSLPETLTELGERCLSGSSPNRIIMPTGVTTVPSYCMNSCKNTSRIFLPDGITTVGDYGISDAYSLRKFSLPKSLVTVGQYFLCKAYYLKELIIPESLTTIDARCCTGSALERLIIKSPVFNPSNSKSYFADNISEIIITHNTIMTSNSDFRGWITNYYCDLYVPDEVVDDYKDGFANEYANLVHPLSEYPGTIPE